MSFLPRLVPMLVLVLALASAWPARAQVGETTVTLSWTAPGDDSTTGRATGYDLRWSRTPIVTAADHAAATPVAGLPAPSPSGSPETFTVGGLLPGTEHWFALRTLDERGNVSILSNVVRAVTLPSADVTPPAAVALTLVAAGDTDVSVSWADVGDDGLDGIAAAVEVRWAYEAITEANWDAAVLVVGLPAPDVAGTPHTITFTGMDRDRDVWVVARAVDDVNRLSPIESTLLVPRRLDTAPPAAPAGLGLARVANGVRLAWDENAEPDLAGYHAYRATAATGPFVRVSTTLLPTALYTDAAPPDSARLWYAVTAVDASGNEGARSASVVIVLRAVATGDWAIEAPWPNPSATGQPVTIPLRLPTDALGRATVEIQDAAGQRVRVLTVVEATRVEWDGRNDQGRVTAPGLYRAWLRGDGRARLTRIVRVP